MKHVTCNIKKLTVFLFRHSETNAGFTPLPQQGMARSAFSKLMYQFILYNKQLYYFLFPFSRKKAMPCCSTGFTLLETIVAVSVLILATAGPLTLASKSIQTASLIRNQTIGYFLAEETVEFIHNKVDENSLEGQDWVTGMDACFSADGCIVDVPNNSLTACSGACPLIRLDDASGLYNYVSGDNSVFRITAHMNIIDSDSLGLPREVQVNVEIEWPFGISFRRAQVTEHIFNWR